MKIISNYAKVKETKQIVYELLFAVVMHIFMIRVLQRCEWFAIRHFYRMYFVIVSFLSSKFIAGGGHQCF